MFLGIIYVVLASVAFGFAPVFSKEIVGTGVNIMSMLAITNAIATVVIGVMLLIRRPKMKVTKEQILQLVVFSGGGYAMTILLLNNSYGLLPIGLATMLHFIYPVVVTVGMVVFFKERLSVVKVTAIFAALIGLYLILDITGETSLKGALLALGSGFAYAIYVGANRKANYSQLPALVVVFSTVLVPFLGFTIYGLITKSLMLPPTGKSWILISAASIVDHLFAIYMLTCAIRRLGASNAAIGNMLEPMTSLLLGIVIYNDRIQLSSLVGCGLILLAVLIIIFSERLSEKKVKQRIRQ